MARSPAGTEDMHIDLPSGPQYPQGPSRQPHHLARATSALVDTPDTPGSDDDASSATAGRWTNQPATYGANFPRYRSLLDDPNSKFREDPPAIPSALPISSGYESTPLPKIPMIVLSIAVLGEFLSANVSTPFIVDMTRGFLAGGDVAELGSYTGAIVASFFVTQFLTSLLWATVASKHGNRAVLFVALLGNALTCALFGTSRTFAEAIAIRLIMGVFNGAVGVARSTVTAVTDPSNESRAYGIMGFSWGLGGVAGAIIGGVFETPSRNWPNSFGRVPLFRSYPYLLPTSIASAVLLTGAILSLFLAWDGGPQGSIQLPIEKNSGTENGNGTQPAAPTNIDLGNSPIREVDDDRTPSFGALGHVMRTKISGYFARRVHEAYGQETPTGLAGDPSSPSNIPPPLGSPIVPRARAYSRNARFSGSAYGYRPRAQSQSTISTAVRGTATPTGGIRHRRPSTRLGAEPSSLVSQDDGLSLAQRLLIANENAGASLPGLWVAAAINVDNEDPFEGDEDEEVLSDEEDYGDTSFSGAARQPSRSFGARGPSFGAAGPSSRSRHSSPAGARPHGQSFGATPSRRPFAFSMTPSTLENGFGARDEAPLTRRPSVSSHILLPAIYSNTGVTTPPALLEALNVQTRADGPVGASANDVFQETLTPIVEGQVTSNIPRTDAVEKVDLSFRWSLLPLFIIFQYFVLALHSTSHDQVFLMYVTSQYARGGLGLDPSHFATLIALMCIAQVFYQFYLYPNIGPPRGKLSHLAMFRLGSLLFIPGYVTVTFYRIFASSQDEGNVVLMSLLAISTAVRYAGSTFAYTSVAVLLNYMSPPHMVAFSNGLAQSLASLARVIGPLFGGWLWAETTKQSAAGYPLGFYACSVICAAAILLSFFIR